ncbi:MAG: prepilin peptidase [Hadesarchaea archaeon]|nr:prepilin peptidase [Hadesarchaea archaeon]
MFEPELIPAAIALGAVCIAVYTDLRERIIPNRLTFPLIGVGILFYFLFGVYRGDLLIVASGALGAAISFAIGYAMWLTGGWAGGDVKLFTALGALLPRFSPSYAAAPYSSTYPLFPLTILINSVIVSIPVLLVYAAICRARGRGALYERVRITELKEGDIPAETIYEREGKVGRWSSRFGRKPRWDRTYTNPSRAAGLTRYQVGALKRLVRARKLKNEIKIKKGIPFAPALGAGVFIAVLYGDLYWHFISFVV